MELGHLLLEADIPWVSELKRGTVKTISDECSLEVIDGGSILEIDSRGGLLSNPRAILSLRKKISLTNIGICSNHNTIIKSNHDTIQTRLQILS